MKHDLLPNNLNEIPSCQGPLEKYREQNEGAGTQAPGILDGEPFDQALFERGNHKKPAHLVPRRFLEAITEPYQEIHQVDRLTADLLWEDNTLQRVIVNRIWHHLFGHGYQNPRQFWPSRGKTITPRIIGLLGGEVSKRRMVDQKNDKIFDNQRNFSLFINPFSKARDRSRKYPSFSC